MARRRAKTATQRDGAGGRRASKTTRARRSAGIPDELAREIRPELWDARDPAFNIWAVRDPDRDLKRTPGLFWPHRQSRGGAWLGIPTFFKLPIALTPEDLKAGKVDVAIFGAPLDMGFGMRGAAFGPQAIRVSERYVSWADARSGASRPHQHVRVDPFHVLTVVDYGDVAVDPFSTERSIGHVQEFVRAIAETGAIPLMVGGDHSLLWPGAAGVADVYGKGSVGIIHFDAHADASHSMLGHLAAHGTPVRRLIVDAHIPGRNFIQVGLRGYYPDDETVEWMRSVGMRSHYMAEVERKGWDAVLRRALEEALDGPRYLYISLDVDVMDPAYTPGTGTPEPGGLTPRELFPLLRRLTAENTVVGIDVVEMNPLVDPGYTTALNVNRCIREMLVGLALRKQGIKTPDYLDRRMQGDA
ncbi:MAG: agmatinase family protein [Candidatus Rokuibacteriota bacterium]